MRRSVRLAVLAAAVGLVAPVAASQTAVSAIDQDLVISAASGAPRDEITVSSASCDIADSGDSFGYLWVRLVSGTAPDQVLAASGVSDVQGGDATLVIPDWVDPDAAAEIQAACVRVTFPEDFDEAPTYDREWYDPVAFDVVPGVDAPVQQQTYSRTSLQAGQAFSVAASGCFLAGADHAYVDVIAGDDLTLREPEGVGINGEGELDGDGFDIPTALVNGGVSIQVSGDSAGNSDVEIIEVPTDLPPGPYTALASCGDDTTNLLFEPQLIEITGTAPMADVDLVAQPDSRTVTFGGGSCTAGDVEAWMFADDIDQVFADGDAGRSAAHRARPTGLAAAPRPSNPFDAPSSQRILDGDGAELQLTPDADGSWAHTDDVAYDHALVGGFSVCGDPLADGFIYNDQAVEVEVQQDTTTTAPVTTTTAPAPVPANAVAGTPTYAG